jgi:outer membrane protein OmpA-like peptidoglycan-associated protein
MSLRAPSKKDEKDQPMKQSIIWTTLVALGLSACGADLAPRELLDARQAYEKAKAGPASQYALAQLETAKQALQEANSAFEEGEDDQVADLAYVAERKAQLAEAAGELEQANRERAAAVDSKAAAQDDYQKATEKELQTSRRAIEEEKLKRQQAEERAKAALASLEEMGKVKEEARGTVITLDGSVLFASGKYDLLPIARQKLTDIARALKDQGYKTITVEGHTDSRGSDTTNRQLSENRAMAVRTLMVSEGIEPTKITSVGLGEIRPIADNNTAEGRANNRRVEIIVVPE